ncbi:MAG: U32 family peptidase, partial [Clostridiales bacterium]|nr:U32 family peptidase [Clostridiales bacterium]
PLYPVTCETVLDEQVQVRRTALVGVGLPDHSAADVAAAVVGGALDGGFCCRQRRGDQIHEIQYAHLLDRKVYLTVNTLLRDSEIEMLYDYLLPFYEVGLDGVIIQDVGVFQYIKEQFPNMELHISTQMAITGKHGAEYVKNIGASRIVPARELTLAEIKEIKENVPIEIETFVHGAMCYCYSGNCLFSSILGGRSGNRGRCAQPCRLPYQVTEQKNTSKSDHNKEEYILSLKDMCTIEMIPLLIEAGIDSFKIEGRMKRSEYTAGVTAMYRKYIDLYYKDPKAIYKISEEDSKLLSTLYVRSDLSEGYYKQKNGKNMVTLDQPSYNETKEVVLENIRKNYLNTHVKHKINAKIVAAIGEPFTITLFSKEDQVMIKGEIIEPAMNQPADKEMITKQIMKTGDSDFVIDQIDIEIIGNVFLPVKAINEVRRSALAQLKEVILEKYRRKAPESKTEACIGIGNHDKPNHKERQNSDRLKSPKLAVLVSTYEQLKSIVKIEHIDRIYLESDLFLKEHENLNGILDQYSDKAQFIVALPYVLRSEYQPKLQKLVSKLNLLSAVKGFLIRNMETIGWLNDIQYNGIKILDYNIYIFNSYAKEYWTNHGYEVTTSYELNSRQMDLLTDETSQMLLYGRIPLMVTANCIRKTKGQCKTEGNNILYLEDRMKKKFPVLMQCNFCYNVIYNSLPVSLHNYIDEIEKKGPGYVNLNFTTENDKEVYEITTFFCNLLS